VTIREIAARYKTQTTKKSATQIEGSLPPNLKFSKPDYFDFKKRCAVQIAGEPFERVFYGLNRDEYLAVAKLSLGDAGNTIVKNLKGFETGAGRASKMRR
jgi:hypothetical protein